MSCARKMWRNFNPHTLTVEMEDGSRAVGNSLAVLKKLNLELSCDLAFSLPCFNPRELKIIHECSYQLYPQCQKGINNLMSIN